MVFRVLLHQNAAKELKKLDGKNQAKMRQALEELLIDPYKAGKQLHPSDFWSLRSGDYRAIYEIDSNQKQVTLLFVGHRKKMYDNFSTFFKDCFDAKDICREIEWDLNS